MEFDNIETLKRAIELDCGVAIVPEATIRQEVDSQTLAAVPLEGDYCRPLGAIHRKTKCCPRPLSSSLRCSKSRFEPPVMLDEGEGSGNYGPEKK